MNIEERKPIWTVLADLYLDNELQDYDFNLVANKISESPYNLEEVRRIDRNEVFPVLHSNLLGITGIWDGFEEEWLIEKITKNLSKRNALETRYMSVMYRLMQGIFRDHWEKIEQAHGLLDKKGS